MRSYRIILALLVLAAITLTFALTRTVPEVVTGAPHPNHEAMNQGGSSSRHDERLWLGWLYGSLQIGIFMLCLRISVRKEKKKRGWLTIGTVLYLIVFSGLMLAYAQEASEPTRVLGFPLPTALLVYGMWPISALFVVLYTVHFREWVYSEEDAERFAVIKAKYPGGAQDDA